MRILVTRAADQARATAIRLATLGHEAVVAPLTAVAFDRDVALPYDGAAALVATSTNAVEALAGRRDLAALVGVPMFVVGARTARAARTLGFPLVISADGDRTDLVGRLATDLSPDTAKVPLRLVWLAGRDRTETFAEELRGRGFLVDVVEVYRAEEGGPLPEAIAADLDAGRIDAIAVYSPRSGGVLLSALLARGFSPSSKRPAIHAISEAAASAFRAAGWPDVIVASRPDEAALLATFGPPMGKVPGAESENGPSAVSTGDEARRTPMAAKRNRTGSELSKGAALDVPADATSAGDLPASEPQEAKAAAEAAVPIEAEIGDAVVVAPSEERPATATATDAEAVVDAAPSEEASEPARPTDAVAVAPVAGGSGRIVVASVIAALVGGGLGVGGSTYLAEQRGDRAVLEAKLAGLEARLAAVAGSETRLVEIEKKIAEAKPVDLSPLEKRLAAVEKAPALTLPTDVATRLVALEDAAKARIEAAKTSVSDTLSSLPQDARNPALVDLAAKVDAAIAASREEAAARSAQLEARISTIVGAAADRVTLEALHAAVADTFNRMGAEVDRRTAETAAALDGMRQRVGGLEGLRGEVDGLVGRLGGLESVTKEAKTDRDRVAETIEVARSKTESRVGSMESKVAALEAGANETREAQARAVIAVALADLKSAVDAGRPFRAELDVVKAASSASPLDLGVLDGFADKGVPTTGVLRDRLHAVTRAMHEAREAETAGPSWSDRLFAHAGNLVRVRPVGDSGGTDMGALVSRIEVRMAAGDLAGALAVWKTLPETARKASVDWGAALEARVTVDGALATATSAAVSKLSPTRP